MKKSSGDNWDSLEKNWREKLDSHKEEVPAAIWNQIEKKLDEKKGKAVPFIIHRRQWSWAAVLLISFGVGWWQLSNPNALVDDSKMANHIQTEINAPVQHLPNTSTPELEEISSSTNPNVVSHSEPMPSHDIHSNLNQEPRNTTESIPVIEESKPNTNPVILADNRTFEKEKPASLAKEESVEMLIDIQPSQANNQEKENSYVPEPSKKRHSLFARVVKQLRQAIDGEPVDWQTLKQGDPKLENSIHQVANTYIKTEQVVQRTFQF
ncbi:hypothetical protein EWU23_06005 [Cytophagaceae bacterium 50C-KIRBA]|uniref:Anti-sigma factor n=1 Tax=Aquirufa beregesia TaxID=2516556 RepID=A0ABX0EU13_9BACT|nr:hypothetical protein [Aquirufa beregesia]NGZ44021.1 hypothetical protein [Aquirufa beregesia]